MPRFTSIFAAGALAVALSGGVTAAQAAAVTPTPASSSATMQVAATSQSITIKTGPKLRARSGFKTKILGAINGPNGKRGFCINPGKGAPDGTWHEGAVKNIKNPTVRAQAQWLVNSEPNAIGTKTLEPAVDAALLRIIDAEWRSDWKTTYVKELRGTGVVALSDILLARAKTYTGAVTVKTVMTKKPGKNGAGAIRAAVTMNGHPAAGVPLKWYVTGAKTAGGTRTGKDGTAVLKLTRNGLAPVAWTVVAVTPEWRKAHYSTPTTAARQHLMRPGFTVTSRASGSYTSAVVTQDCGTRCDGRPPVTIDATAGKTATQWRALDSTKTVGTLTLKARRSGKATFTAADGQHLVVQHREKTAHGWSKWRTAQTFDVICPPWPAVQLTCACDGVLTVTLTPTGIRYYTATVGSKTVDLNGPTTVTTALKTDEQAGITVTAYADAAHTKSLGSHKYGTWTQG